MTLMTTFALALDATDSASAAAALRAIADQIDTGYTHSHDFDHAWTLDLPEPDEPLTGEELAVAYTSFVQDLWETDPETVKARYGGARTPRTAGQLTEVLGADTDLIHPSKWALSDLFAQHLRDTGRWLPDTAAEFAPLVIGAHR